MDKERPLLEDRITNELKLGDLVDVTLEEAHIVAEIVKIELVEKRMQNGKQLGFVRLHSITSIPFEAHGGPNAHLLALRNPESKKIIDDLTKGINDPLPPMPFPVPSR